MVKGIHGEFKNSIFAGSSPVKSIYSMIQMQTKLKAADNSKCALFNVLKHCKGLTVLLLLVVILFLFSLKN